jgi:hypothetical protein
MASTYDYLGKLWIGTENVIAVYDLRGCVSEDKGTRLPTF